MSFLLKDLKRADAEWCAPLAPSGTTLMGRAAARIEELERQLTEANIVLAVKEKQLVAMERCRERLEAKHTALVEETSRSDELRLRLLRSEAKVAAMRAALEMVADNVHAFHADGKGYQTCEHSPCKRLAELLATDAGRPLLDALRVAKEALDGTEGPGPIEAALATLEEMGV